MTACTGGKRIALKDRDRLGLHGASIRTDRILRLEGSDDTPGRVVFESGSPLECDVLFFSSDQVQRSELPAMLGCESRENDHVQTHGKQRTRVPGLFLAGDADGDVQFVIVAAAEGARAAVAINRELQDEDRGEIDSKSFAAARSQKGIR